MNLYSSSVKVYPSARRGATNAYSRLLSEEAMTRLINTLIDYDGFVISDDNNTLRFNIKGFYFEVELDTLTDEFSAETSIYGTIQLTQFGDFWELDGQDSGNVYTGIDFGTTDETSYADKTYSLKLLEKSGSS